MPSREGADEGHVIPDATFALTESRLFRGAPSWMPAQGVAMVVEVTSSRPELDRVAKRLAYAAAGIPLYLLVDRKLDTVTVFHGPRGADYSRTIKAPFGDKLDLPAPFSFALDTSDFAD